jgi:peptidoglycan hydrolase-like protein with peptidoglycan-binding domain
MAKRFIISEEERSNIRSRYGLINEQPIQLSSQEVFELQTALNDYFKMKKVMSNGKIFQIPVDDKWGPTTIDALKKFQTMEKINSDGIPGGDTYNALHKLGLDQDIIDKAINFVKDLDCNYVYISLPWCHNFSEEWFMNWKHRRPDEHLWHFNKKSIENFFNEMGYDMVDYSNVEDLIRVSGEEYPNILTCIFKKRK